MLTAAADWARGGADRWEQGPASLAQLRSQEPSGAGSEALLCGDAGERVTVVTCGRVDNRHELAEALGIPSGELGMLSDTELIRRVYLRWREQSPPRLQGDWALAAWHVREKRLFLARDRFGITALYHLAGPGFFAFASSRDSLLALGLARLRMDELYLAQVLIAWPAYHGERTIYHELRRLPPAHCLHVDAGGSASRCYWRLEETPQVRLPRTEDYAETLRSHLDEAVKCRLRSPGPLAVSLSGGLDSSSVTVTAASLLRARGRRLAAFTSVPLSRTEAFVGKCFGDEYPFARSTAEFAGNVDLLAVDAASTTPLEGVRRYLRIHGEPAHAAGNAFWMLAVHDAARAQGCQVLLTGQMGNAGLSWPGDIYSQSVAEQFRQLGPRQWLVESLKRSAPRQLRMAWQRWRNSPPPPDRVRASALHPELARRLRVHEQRLEAELQSWPPGPLQARLAILKPGRNFIGAIHAQQGAAAGLEILDPTSDVRLLQFCLSVPDEVHRDRETGLDRWLVREAMKGRLPDAVRLNSRRGRQAGDLVPRLRAIASEVDATLVDRFQINA
ncbi:MAG: asparagine synthetase B, partial [Candidatus Wallbacteria bacterium]|nr:asparagine synthetase B [Candidatus Wallbacteria bacterium]